MKIKIGIATTDYNARLRQANHSHIVHILRLLVVALLLSGCASKEVKEENRNTDGRYDGRWVGKIRTTPAQVNIENWRVNCWDMAGQIVVYVKEGKVRTVWRSLRDSSYVDDNGRFRLFMPHLDKLKNNPGTVGSLNRGLNYILIGTLEGKKPSGRLTMAYEDFANQGCTSKVIFEKK